MSGKYLLDGKRFKLSLDATGKTGAFAGFASDLNGVWVALVDAKDDRHLKKCEWSFTEALETWQSSCGGATIFNDGDNDPIALGIKYCHACGCSVTVAAREAV